MRYLLDTNTLIAIFNDPSSPASRRLRNHPPSDVAISSIVAYELYYGAFKSARQVENVERVDALQFQILPFDREDARNAGDVRAALERSGTPIGSYDILIAGQARSRNLILATNNSREFSRVDGLQIEDWHR
jgi:tRNA(fMet)-specific endonuclease VapC